MTTLRSTVPCWRRGRVRRAFGGKTSRGGPASGAASGDFHRDRRRNATHRSTTDPDARLYKKARGHEATLAYLGHVLAENRHGFIVDATVTRATGTAEREAAEAMVRALPSRARRTLGADRNFDTRGFVATLRTLGVTPHVAQYRETPRRGNAIDRRATRHAGYAISQRARMHVEQPFGWMKTIGLLHKLRHRGCPLVGWVFTFTAAAYNLVRLRRFVAQPA